MLLIVVVASPVLLWFGANAFLNIGLEPIINAKPDKLRIHWSLAWMWMPGDVSVWGLEIRGQGKNDQYLITNDHAIATVDVHALTERTFRASHVKGNGATFRYRFRAKEPVDPALDDTPPIVGLTNPPDPIPPPGKSKKGPWQIELQGMDVDDVRELWVEGIHYVGNAHVVGDLTLGNEISLAGHLTMPTGKIFRGAEREIVDSVTGEAGGKLSGILRGQPITPEVLANLEATAHLKAQADDLSFVNYYLQAAPWMKLDGRAELAIDVDVKGGAYALGSVVSAHTTDMVVDLFEYEIRGDGTARLEVVSGDEGPETHMGVSYGQFTIREKTDEPPDPAVEPLVSGNGFELTAVSPETDIGKPRTNMNVLVKIPESTIPDVKRFDRYLPTGTGLAIVGGSGRLGGYLQASTATGQLAGGVDLTGKDLAIRFNGMIVAFDLALHARLAGGTGKYEFSGTSVAIDRLGMHDLERNDEAVARDWWARITVKDGTVNVAAPKYLDGLIAMQCANSEPITAVLLQKQNLPRWLHDALYVPNVRGTARVQVGNDTIVVDPLEVSGGTELTVKMRFYRKGTASTGAMYAKFNKFSVAVDIDPGDTDIHMFDAKDWYEGNNADKAAAKDAKQAKKDAKKDAKAKKKAAKKSDG